VWAGGCRSELELEQDARSALASAEALEDLGAAERAQRMEKEPLVVALRAQVRVFVCATGAAVLCVCRARCVSTVAGISAPSDALVPTCVTGRCGPAAQLRRAQEEVSQTAV
jgi:hypothetical protein